MKHHHQLRLYYSIFNLIFDALVEKIHQGEWRKKENMEIPYSLRKDQPFANTLATFSIKFNFQMLWNFIIIVFVEIPRSPCCNYLFPISIYSCLLIINCSMTHQFLFLVLFGSSIVSSLSCSDFYLSTFLEISKWFRLQTWRRKKESEFWLFIFPRKSLEGMVERAELV